MPKPDRDELSRRLRRKEVNPSGVPGREWLTAAEFHLVVVAIRVGRGQAKWWTWPPDDAGRSDARVGDSPHLEPALSLAVRQGAERLYSAFASWRAADAKQIWSTWERALADCSADLAALGYGTSEAMKLGYISRFEHWAMTPFRVEHWGLPKVNEDELETALDSARRNARPSDLELLPGASAKRPSRRGRRPSAVEVADQPGWDQACRNIAYVRTQHEFALAARTEFLRLDNEAMLKAGNPSKAVFRERLEAEIKRLLSGTKDISRVRLERVIGACAADASHWRLGALKWQLEQATLDLQPSGKYFSRRQAPARLGALGALEDQLFACLRGKSAESKEVRVQAAMNVYSGRELSDPRTAARNAGRLRRQRAERRAALAARQLTVGAARKRRPSWPD